MSKFCKSFIFFLKFWTPSIAAFCLSFYLSSLESNELPRWDFPHLDKVVHFLSFIALSTLLVRALLAQKHFNGYPSSSKAALLYAILICLAYAIIDEWHQSFSSTRMVEALDVLADWFGSFAGVWLANSFYKNKDF